jgi:hypothetical protein
MVQIDLYEARKLLSVLWASSGVVQPRRISNLVANAKSLRELVPASRNVLLTAGLAIERGDSLEVGAVTGTLRDAVEPVLTAVGPRSHRGYVRRGIALLYGLPKSSLLADLLSACEQTSIDVAHEVPVRVYRKARDAGCGVEYARNMRSAMITTLENAAVGGMGFPIPLAWLEVTEASDVTGRLVSALAELWSRGELPTRKAIHGRTGVNPGSADRRLNEWAGQRLVGFKETHRGSEIAFVNLSGVDPAASTMRTVLEALREESPLSQSQHRQVFLALRQFMGLPPRNKLHEREIADAAAVIGYAELQRLPDDIYTFTLKNGGSRKTAATLRSAVRAALRWSAERGDVPMIWAEREDDVWTRTRDEWIPITVGIDDGVKTATRACHRTAWNWLKEAALSLYDGALTPADIQEHHLRDIGAWLRRRGRFDHAGAVSAAMNYAGRRGHGPRALTNTVESVLLSGRAIQQTWEGLIELTEEHKMRPEWRAFLTWYGSWSTADWAELDLHDLPERPNSRVLGEGTLLGRAKALRWLLGILKSDGWNLSELMPEDVLSFETRRDGRVIGLKRTIALGQRIWRDRHDAEELSSPVGSSLRQYIIGAGLLAEALYRRHRHSSGYSVAMLEGEEASRKPRYGVDSEAEEGARSRTPVEDQLWRAYRHTCTISGRLKEAARNWGTAETINTTKDLVKLLEMTPPTWYSKLVETYLRLARRSLETDGVTRDHHELIRDAFLTCMLVSTGLRGEELVHVRLDIHLPPWWSAADRSEAVPVSLRAVDRKNDKRHVVQLFPQLVPAWLRAAYRESRLWLMRDLTVTSERFGLKASEQHMHLLVDNAGRAFGCPGENERGEGRPRKKQIEKRVGRLRELWKNHAGRVAWEHAGLECPTLPGYFTIHAVRNVYAAGLFIKHGQTAAANWLGDIEQSVQGHYGCLLGSSITAELMRDAGAVGAALPSAGKASLENLLGQLAESGWTEGDLMAALSALQSEHRRCA